MRRKGGREWVDNRPWLGQRGGREEDKQEPATHTYVPHHHKTSTAVARIN